MELNNKEEQKKSLTSIFISAIICAAILFTGIAGMKMFAGMKKPPAESVNGERPLQVEAVTIKKSEFPVTIKGYGEAKALEVVDISPEISGKVIAVHPRLEVGEIISEGEVIFEIDPRDYEIIIETGRKRLQILNRRRELAKKEFQRVSKLYQKNRVGTRSTVESVEQAWLSAADIATQIQQVVETAELNLSRCQVSAPFDGRIKSVGIENGQFVSPGRSSLTLVNDSVLEIAVALDSRDASKWLEFNSGTPGTSWFAGIKKVPCEIEWTETESGNSWRGLLHRVLKFDSKTRTLSVAIRIERNFSYTGRKDRFPLVDGMFCEVKIPGKKMTDVVRLPRWSVSYEDTVYISDNNRLKTIQVDVIRREGDYVFVSGGLDEGDIVITTRLVDPLETSLLKIINGNTGESE